MTLFSRIQNETFFFLGPCVIENQELLYTVAEELKRAEEKYKVPVVFMASFDKANRTAITSFRKPGIDKGLEMLAKVKEHFGLPLLTDIHESSQAEAIGQVVDVIQ